MNTQRIANISLMAILAGISFYTLSHALQSLSKELIVSVFVCFLLCFSYVYYQESKEEKNE